MHNYACMNIFSKNTSMDYLLDIRSIRFVFSSQKCIYIFSYNVVRYDGIGCVTTHFTSASGFRKVSSLLCDNQSLLHINMKLKVIFMNQLILTRPISRFYQLNLTILMLMPICS